MKAVGAIFMAWSVAVPSTAVRRPPTTLNDPPAHTDLHGDRARVRLYHDLLSGFAADHATLLVFPAGAAGLLERTRSTPDASREPADRRTTSTASGGGR